MNTETFADFIINNKDSIIKRCKVTKMILEISSNSLIKDIVYDESMIKRWHSTINSAFQFKMSSSLMDALCFYCEVFYLYKDKINTTPFGPPTHKGEIDLSNHLKKIHINITRNTKRSKIIDKYYNYHTGKVEYLLEDNTYLPIEGNNPIIEMNYKFFPTEFLPLLSESEYRNSKIDQIL